MLMKAATLVFMVASAAATGPPCGWRGEGCCDIDPHNPNIGECFDARTYCWEAVCQGCGGNGKKACETAPRCDKGTVMDSNGWCGYSQDAPARPQTCDGPCGVGQVCNTHNGQCESCGAVGTLPCDGSGCNAGLIVNGDGYCDNDPDAPFMHAPCTTPCGHAHICLYSRCVPCGEMNEPACEGDVCWKDLVLNDDGYCVKDHCGWVNEKCCDSGPKCFDGAQCLRGVCQRPAAPAPPTPKKKKKSHKKKGGAKKA